MKKLKDIFESTLEERSYEDLSDEKLKKLYNQMKDEQLSAIAAAQFRLIVKAAKKRKLSLNESSELSKDDLKPGTIFFVISKDRRSLSRYKITGEKELNVGTVLEVKHTVISGDKFRQSVISKDFVLGSKGDIKVFKNKKDATKAFKMAKF